MKKVYVVTDSDHRIMMITTNPHTAAGIYFRERQKIFGERPYIEEYGLGKEIESMGLYEPRLLGHDEIGKLNLESRLLKDLNSKGDQ